MTTVKFQRLHPDAQLPAFATDGAACFDLVTVTTDDVPSFSARTFSTGLAVELPPGHVMLVFSRSGHGFKHDLRLANCVGVIDADYRGEILVKMRNDSCLPFGFAAGDRVAQAMIMPLPVVQLVEVPTLSSTDRGVGGFGSTGK